MKVFFTLTISTVLLLCSCGSSEDTATNTTEGPAGLPTEKIIIKTIDDTISIANSALEKQVEVQIKIKDPLFLSKYEDGSPMLSGKVEVKVINQGSVPVKLNPLNLHRLRFTNEKSKEVFTVIHSCDCINQRFVTIAPKDTVVRKWDVWSHDGNPFTPPSPGKYLLSYGVNDFSRNKIDYEIKSNFSRNRREAIKLCKEKFAAIKSNKYESESILINLK
jgi:hypothetical protein